MTATREGALGNFRQAWVKVREAVVRAYVLVAETGVSGTLGARDLLAALLLFCRFEKYQLFRAALVFIVVSLAAGENAVVLVCRAWCDAHAAAANECHHENTSTTPSVTGSDCTDMVTAHNAVLREDTRRDFSSADANQATPVRRYQFAQLTIDDRPGQEAGRAWSGEGRPLSTVLRL